MSLGLGYERNGQAIYDRSFSIIRTETDLARFPADLEAVVVRMIHSCGMIDLVDDVDFSPTVGLAARSALEAGAPILADSAMVAHGVTRARLPRDNDVICTLRDPEVAALADRLRTTRTAAAIDLWLPRMEGAVVAIGNAPTALFRLLELLADGALRPAAVIGIPVGFVGAAESKAALASAHREGTIDVPFLTVHGRRGGSAIVAGALNALASDVE